MHFSTWPYTLVEETQLCGCGIWHERAVWLSALECFALSCIFTRPYRAIYTSVDPIRFNTIFSNHWPKPVGLGNTTMRFHSHRRISNASSVRAVCHAFSFPGEMRFRRNTQPAVGYISLLWKQTQKLCVQSDAVVDCNCALSWQHILRRCFSSRAMMFPIIPGQTFPPQTHIASKCHTFHIWGQHSCALFDYCAVVVLWISIPSHRCEWVCGRNKQFANLGFRILGRNSRYVGLSGDDHRISNTWVNAIYFRSNRSSSELWVICH